MVKGIVYVSTKIHTQKPTNMKFRLFNPRDVNSKENTPASLQHCLVTAGLLDKYLQVMTHRLVYKMLFLHTLSVSLAVLLSLYSLIYSCGKRVIYRYVKTSTWQLPVHNFMSAPCSSRHLGNCSTDRSIDHFLGLIWSFYLP